MAYLTKEQVKQVIQNAPEGTNPAGIVAGLRAKGHQLEGYDSAAGPIGTERLTQVASEEIRPESTTLDKAGRFLSTIFGGEKIGEFLAAKTGKFFVPQEQRQFFNTQGPSAGELLGDVAQAGLTVGGLGLGGRVAGIGAKALQSAALGAGFGAAGTLKGGGGAVDALKGAGVGAIAGGVLGTAGGALSAAAKRFVVKTPEQLVNFALKTPVKKVDQGTAQAFLKRGLGGKSLDQVHAIVEKEVNTVGSEIEKMIAAARGGVNLRSFANELAIAANKKFSTSLTGTEILRRVARKVPDNAQLLAKKSLAWKDANLLRRAIDNNLKESTFLGRELTNEERVVKAFTNGLRARIKAGTGTEELFSTQAEAIRIRNLAKTAIDKLATQGRPGLLDTASFGIGTGLGLFGGGLPGGLIGGAAGVAAQRAARSPQFQTGTAQVIQKFRGLGPILQKLSPAERTFLLNIIGRTQE